MSKKEYIVLQPKKTIVDVEYSDGTVVRTESRFWYEGEVAHLKFFVDDNKQLDELRKQLEEKDKEIDKLEQELAFYNEEVKNKGTCGLCEKLEEKAINVLRDKLKEKDKEIEELKANQTPTRKRLTPINWDKYNLADKLRYRNRQVKEALIRISNMNEMEDVLRSQLKDQRHQICEKIREKIYYKLWEIDDGFYMMGNYALPERYHQTIFNILDQIEKGGEKE